MGVETGRRHFGDGQPHHTLWRFRPRPEAGHDGGGSGHKCQRVVVVVSYVELPEADNPLGGGPNAVAEVECFRIHDSRLILTRPGRTVVSLSVVVPITVEVLEVVLVYRPTRAGGDSVPADENSRSADSVVGSPLGGRPIDHHRKLMPNAIAPRSGALRTVAARRLAWPSPPSCVVLLLVGDDVHQARAEGRVQLREHDHERLFRRIVGGKGVVNDVARRRWRTASRVGA
jgi:hypothetical protein